MLQIGQKAPLFEAESTKGSIKIADYIGKQYVVLIFYPEDDTFICTKQLCAVRDSKAQYEKHNAAVFGVNPGSMEEHQKFSQKFMYDFPLISDSKSSIRDQFDVGTRFLLPGQQRIVFVIDLRGSIIYARKGNRSTQEILKAIEANNY